MLEALGKRVTTKLDHHLHYHHLNKFERKEKQKKRRKEARKITQGEGEDDEGKGKKKLLFSILVAFFKFQASVWCAFHA